MGYSILQDIEGKIEEIKEAASIADDEAAHNKEDALYFEFIEAIVEGEFGDDATLQAAARLVLSTQDIRFKRYCG